MELGPFLPEGLENRWGNVEFIVSPLAWNVGIEQIEWTISSVSNPA